jgi:hypothetical protein
MWFTLATIPLMLLMRPAAAQPTGDADTPHAAME